MNGVSEATTQAEASSAEVSPSTANRTSTARCSSGPVCWKMASPRSRPGIHCVFVRNASAAAGFAAYSLMPPNSAPLTVELKINLMSPAVGETFIAEARVLRSGKTLTIVEVDVKAQARAEGERKLIARMLATMICIENTTDAPEEKRG